MKRFTCIMIFGLSVLNFVEAKKLPDFVQVKLDSIKKEAKKSLDKYRIWDREIDGYKTLPRGLGFYLSEIFSYEETYLTDSLGLNISVGMIYDDEMRNRIVQLLRNEYRKDEMDTLLNRYINWNLSAFEWQAFEISKIDTFSIFKNAMDSLYLVLETGNTLDMSKKLNRVYDYEVFKSLRLDTIAIFRQVYNKVIEQKTKKMREEKLNNTYSYFSYVGNLAELCGYINDKRFIQPLIEVLNKPFYSDPDSDLGLGVDSAWKESVHQTVIEALTRMRVEPYYSDYVKKRTLTMEQIKDEDKWLDFKIEDFVNVLGTQEAFLELSNYLLSNKPYSTIVIDYEDHPEHRHYPVSDNAFILIRDNIENREVQEMIGKKSIEDYTPYLKPLYEWMQKNYGKYKIKRIW